MSNKLVEDAEFADDEAELSANKPLIQGGTIKMAILLLILFVFISSDVFVDRILPNRYVLGGHPTSRGVLIQGIVLSIAYILLNFLIERNLV